MSIVIILQYLFCITEYLLEQKSLGAVGHVLAVTILRPGENNQQAMMQVLVPVLGPTKTIQE